MTKPLPDAPLSALLSAAAQIEGMDIELALRRISRKQHILEDCIEQTARSAPGKLRQMSKHLSADDLRAFSVEAHGLKVALAEVGATGHSALAAQLERDAKAGDASACKRDFIPFAAMTKTLAGELEALLPRQERRREPGDPDFLHRVLRESRELLDAFEADEALLCLNKLDRFTFGEETDALLTHIRDRIKAYQYEDAVLTLRSLSY